MRTTFDDHHHRTPDHNHFQQKTIYLPMFCRLSLKDIRSNNHSYKDPKICTTGGEPSSPKVSCIGQVKRNNRITGFPTTTATAAANHQKHAKLKNLLPGSNLAGVNTGRRSGSRSCRSTVGRENMNMIMCVNTSSSSRRSRSKTTDHCDHNSNDDQDCAVDIGEMDPPLPVVKKVAPPGNEVNIWKRRFNGDLKSLRVERIQLPVSKFQSPPTL